MLIEWSVLRLLGKILGGNKGESVGGNRGGGGGEGLRGHGEGRRVKW